METERLTPIDESLIHARSLLNKGSLSEAQGLLHDIIKTSPEHSGLVNLLGVLAVRRGQKSKAESLFRHAIALDQANAEAWSNLSVVLRELGNLVEAESVARRALELDDSAGDAWISLGLSLFSQQRWEEASQTFRGLLALDPNNAFAWRVVGVSEQNLGRMSEAAVSLERCWRLTPDDADATVAYGFILTETDRWYEAVAVLSRLLQQQPQIALAWLTLGCAYEHLCRFGEAEACYRQAARLAGPDPAPRLALARVLEAQSSLEAQAVLEEILAQYPDYADAHGQLGMIMLRRGDFDRGWREYEWRWKTSQLPTRTFRGLPWNGESLAGRTILLYAEQGFGDTFQFVRYGAVLKSRGATVVLECPPELLRVLATCPAIDRVVGTGETVHDVDFHVAMLSVPRLLKTTLETIPTGVPYLSADRSLIEHWRSRLKDVPGFRIGINWQGRSGRGPHRLRDIPKELLAGLAELPGVRLISLQKSPTEFQHAQVLASDGYTKEPAILDLGALDQEGAFVDTAAIMMNLDLVITSDTAVAHLAGALGVPAWVALPFVADWRWLLDRSDSLWYPTMRLFRQKNPGDWPGVVQEIREELTKFIAAPE